MHNHPIKWYYVTDRTDMHTCFKHGDKFYNWEGGYSNNDYKWDGKIRVFKPGKMSEHLDIEIKRLQPLQNYRKLSSLQKQVIAFLNEHVGIWNDPLWDGTVS